MRRGPRVLVTGAQGFLGRYLVADWLVADPDVSILGLGRSQRLNQHFTHAVRWGESRVQAPLPSALARSLQNERYRYRAVDMADTKLLVSVIAEFCPDIIVHLAASLRDDPPLRLVQTNIAAVVSLLESVVEAEVARPRILFGSSGSVYGLVPDRHVPLREDAVCAPSDPYAVTKFAAERLARILAERHGIPAVWARIFNPVGPGQDERHLCGWLGQQVAAIADGAHPPKVSVGPLHTTRDYIDVRDVASALRLLATRADPNLVFNVASGRETSGQWLLDTMLGLFGLADRVVVEHLPGRAVDIDRVCADVSGLADLGHCSLYPLEQSLADVLTYYRDCVSRHARHTT